eukprot:scaffold394_cov166-Amphora_coffeaeformis.AAC.15
MNQTWIDRPVSIYVSGNALKISTALHNFRRMGSDTSIGANIGRINVVLSRMSEQLPGRVTRAAK